LLYSIIENEYKENTKKSNHKVEGGQVMKRNLIIGTIIALIATSCGTSVQMSGRYIDDLYYWPGDAPLMAAEESLPEIGTENQPVDEDLLIISEAGTNSDGTKTLNNYIYADEVPDWYTDVQGQNLESLDPAGEDTLVIPSEDGETYIVNNYYMDDDFSYSERIRRFHDPYYYDPYWNFSFNWGWGYPYYSSYHRWNSWYWDPWYGSSWYWDPWYYDPWYYSWGYSPYYSSWYWGGGYYGHYSPYYYHPHHYNNWAYNDRFDKKDNYDGERQSRRPNALYQGAGGAVSAASATRSREYTALDGPTTNKSINAGSSRRVVNTGENTSSTQKSATTNTPQTSTRNVLTEKRRVSTGVPSNGNSGQSNAVSTGTTGTRTAPAASVRSSSSTTSQPRVISGGSSSSGTRSTYTPSYNKPRTNTRSTYNTNRTTGTDLKSYSVPSESNRSYSAPSQSRSTRSTYQIPSTRSESSSSGTPSPTYRSSSPSQRSSGYSTSSPSRSSSSYSSPSSGSSRSSYSSPSSGSSRSSSSYSSGSSSGSSRSYSSGSSSGGSSRSSGSSSSSSSSGSSRGGRR